MLTIFKTIEGGLERLEQPVNGCWINVIDPTPEEITQLEAWDVEADLIQYSLDVDEMAHTERDENYTFILLRVPYFQGAEHDVPYTSIPIGIILKNNFVVTICRRENDILRALYNGKYRGLKTGKRHRFVLYILLETALRYLYYLRAINRAVEDVEDRLQVSTRNKEVMELLKYQKSLTYFATALRSNEVMMERLQRNRLFNQYEEDQDLLEDVLTENQQAIQMVSIATDILSGMMDAFASIISNNLNTVMKALAALTIVINIPTIVASFLGMNVQIPGPESPVTFWFIVVISIVLAGIAAYIFVKRDWF
ncbi:MAG: magnesium transporter CorA family protein [Candidatus Villigracilaceae bacterium]